MNLDELKKYITSFFKSHKILNNLPDIVLYIDSNGIIKEFNAKAKDYLGISENITVNELFVDGMNQVVQSSKFKKAIIVQNKAPNEYMELFASKIGNNYCVSIRDNTKIINELIQKNSIEKFNNEKNALIVKLENEIKSPLNSITGFSQGLIDGIGGQITDKQSKYLKIIQSNANDLSEFLYKFIDFSYAESLLYESDYKKFDIVIAIKDILKDIHKSENTNIDFYYDGIESRNIYNDFKALNKSIICILENSISSSEKGNIQIVISNPDYESFISYGLDENKKYIQINIKDDCADISQDDFKFICNPYSQTEKGRKKVVRSLRFGVVSILIKRAGGFFGISSDNGNLYTIIIPTEKEEDE